MEIWHIAILVFINGTCWTLDYPVRRTLVGEFSGPEKMGAGISLDSATTNVTRMLGPFLGGVTYGFLGLEGAFIISAVSHFICICIACSLVFEFQPLNQKAESYFLLLKEGLSIVKKISPINRRILSYHNFKYLWFPLRVYGSGFRA